MTTYSRMPIALSHGTGSRVVDTQGKSYLDFLSGLAVTNLGHAHPAVTEALREQAGKLLHCSNLFQIPVQEEVAELLCANSFASRVFFANSGAEANEAALKIARKWHALEGTGRSDFITFVGSFHGRTLATVTATAQPKYQEGFGPLIPGFSYAKFNDLSSVEALITPKTAAIMVEPIQGEGGVVPATPEFLKGLRALCDQHGILLIFDEVQVGMGRTGRMFAHHLYQVEPDIMTLAKALANGVPVGAMLARDPVARALTPGTHASTFGGNPLAMAGAKAVLEVMTAPGFMDQVQRQGEALRQTLKSMQTRHAVIKEVRGAGFIQGLVLEVSCAEVVSLCLNRGLLLNCAAGNVVRILPPLTLSDAEMAEGLAILDQVLSDLF